jgi:hypothetical protein
VFRLIHRRVLVRAHSTGATYFKCQTELDKGFKGVKLNSQLCLVPRLTISVSVSLFPCYVFITRRSVKHTGHFAFLECAPNLDVEPEELKQKHQRYVIQRHVTASFQTLTYPQHTLLSILFSEKIVCKQHNN